MKLLIVVAAVIAVSSAMKIVEGPKAILDGPSATMHVDTGSITKLDERAVIEGASVLKKMDFGVPTVVKMGIETPTLVKMGWNTPWDLDVLKMEKPLLKMGIGSTVKVLPSTFDWDLMSRVKLVDALDSKVILI